MHLIIKGIDIPNKSFHNKLNGYQSNVCIISSMLLIKLWFSFEEKMEGDVSMHDL